jgi:F1F0 ATPase subunit 2
MGMSDAIPLAGALLAGAVLGLLFFGGLWWTVRRGLCSRQPALLFLGSLLLRTAVVLSGFYLVTRGDIRRLLACLLGFFLARMLVTRLSRAPAGDAGRVAGGGET